MKKGISVIICSHNSGTYLKKTLACLHQQKTPRYLKWELIFVDNASNNLDVAKMVCKEWQSDVPLYILHEATKGKYYAFQKAIQVANYCYFIICDDDNFLEQHYLDNAFKLMESDKRIGAVGGLSLPLFEENARVPSWFDHAQEHFAIGHQNPTNGVVKTKHLWGAGLCSRTELYKHLYSNYPSLLIDEREQAKLIAEDTEYCLRLQLIGFKLYYSAELVLQHYIPNERLADAYLNRLQYNREVSFPTLEKYYLFLKVYQASLLNKIRLLIAAPLRYMLTSNKKNKRRQSIIVKCLFFSPFLLKDDELATIYRIHHSNYNSVMQST